MGDWWFLWSRKPGTVRSPKPAEPSFASDRAGSSSMSSGSVCTGGIGAYVVAASTVPASANLALGRERADPQSDTAPPTPTLATLSVDPPSALGPRTTNQTVGSSHANYSSASLAMSVQSRASDRLSMISNSRTSLRAPVQNNRTSQDPRAPHRQFGPGPVAARSRSRSSRSPSPKPSLNTAQPDNLDIASRGAHTFYRADGAINTTVGLQGRADSPSSSHTREQPGRAAIRRRKQKTTSIDLSIQNPSTDSLPTTSINAQEITEEPMEMDTSPPSSYYTLPSDRAETASQNSYTASSATATSAFVLPEDRFVQLIISEQIPRYTKNATISREGKLQSVKRLTTIFLHFPDPNTPDQPSLMQDCSPWIPATHPDGALYFYDPVRRLFTDTDMHDHTLRDELEHFYYYLKKIEYDELLTIPSENYDMVLDLTLDTYNKMQWSYYYACHDTRCLFWLDEYDATHITSELAGVESPAHLKHRLEDLYWNHWSLFPVVFKGRCLPLSVYDELMGILTHGCIDVMTSRSSTLPYDDDQMQKMITLVQKAKEARSDIGSVIGVNIAGGVGSISNVGAVSNVGGMEHYTAATTRLLSFFAHWRFLYFHGQRHARLVYDQTVYDTTKRKRSALVTLLSPLLFFAPEVHLMEMDKLWTDEVIIERAWKGFMTKLLSEWNDLILWSTVMLAVDVGFLAIPGVVPYNLNNGILPTISPQMTILVSLSEATAIISLGASVGSTIISLLLKRHNRTKQELEPAAAWVYLDQTSRKYFGLELMATVFSLPWALLMWSMMMFHVALFCYCWSIPKHESRIVIVSVTGVLLFFLGAYIWTFWESSDKWAVWLDGLPSPIVRALRALHLSRFRDAAMLFRKRFHSYRTNDVGSEHELPDRRDHDGVAAGAV